MLHEWREPVGPLDWLQRARSNLVPARQPEPDGVIWADLSCDLQQVARRPGRSGWSCTAQTPLMTGTVVVPVEPILSHPRQSMWWLTEHQGETNLPRSTPHHAGENQCLTQLLTNEA